jgi:HAD superfamily hydrolase (TIGR01484 family)
VARKSQFKVLAIDVDGTLLFGHEKISAANKEALLEVKSHAMLCLCTGRAPSEAEWIIEELGLHDNYHILGGGAVVKHPGGDLHHLSKMEDDIVSEIRRNLSAHKLFYLADGRWHPDCPPQDRHLSSVSALAVGESLASELTAQFQEICKDYFVTTIADKNNYWIQVTAPECHKGSGINHLIQKLDIKPEEVLAIGDMYNDIPMFELLPHSVAMGNAPDEVKSKASYVTKEVHHDGLAHAVWEFFFNKT